MDPRQAAIRSVLGSMIGDAIALPYEGLKPELARRLFPGPLRPRLLGGRIMVSDDGEHALFTLEALLAGGDFERELAKRMRRWFLALPAGMGLATARACVRLCVGIPASRSGVRSAGNGAAMRAAVIGAWFAHDAEARIRAVETASRITHSDRRAIDGAQLIALAAALETTGQPYEFEAQAQALTPDFDWRTMPNGPPTGYVLHTVPVVIHLWRTASSYKEGVRKAVELGGDTDTVAAILGGIMGIRGEIPEDWSLALLEPRRGLTYLDSLSKPDARPGSPGLLQLPRNLFFLLVVIGHGFRRLWPL